MFHLCSVKEFTSDPDWVRCKQKYDANRAELGEQAASHAFAQEMDDAGMLHKMEKLNKYTVPSTHLLTYSLTHSLTYLLTYLLTSTSTRCRPLACSLTHLLTYLLIYLPQQVRCRPLARSTYHSLAPRTLPPVTVRISQAPSTHPPTYSPTHPRTHARTHALARSLARPPTYPLTHSPTHPLTHARTHPSDHDQPVHVPYVPYVRVPTYMCMHRPPST